MLRIIFLVLIAVVFWIPCVPVACIITYEANLNHTVFVGMLVVCYAIVFVIVASVAERWRNRRRTS